MSLSRYYKIIIWGADDSNVLGLLRELSIFNNDVYVIFQGKKLYCASISKYCKNKCFVKTYEDGIHIISKLYNQNHNKPYLIPSSDLVAETIDQNFVSISKYCIPIGKIKQTGSLEKLLNKYVMSQLAEKNGFTIPKTLCVTKNNFTPPSTYPVILKPLKNYKSHSKEFKTKLCKNLDETLSIINNATKDSTFLLQEYIDKEYDILVYGCRFTDGEIFIPGHFIKDRWYKGADGSHGYIVPGLPESINFKSITHFLDTIGYCGLFSFEFGFVGGISYFYEVNLRNDGTSHYFSQAGANVPAYLIAKLDDAFSVKKLPTLRQCQFIDEINDYLNVNEGIVTRKIWEEQKSSSTVFRYYDKYDVLPYLYQVTFRAIKILLTPLKPVLLRLLN